MQDIKTCNVCGTPKPITNFPIYQTQRLQDGTLTTKRRAACRMCTRNKREVNGRCRLCTRPTTKKVCDDCNKKQCDNGVKRRESDRLSCFEHYGVTCACCGQPNLDYLTIDHVQGGGSEHKRQLGWGHLPGWLRRNNYPAGFQTLCYNCNCAKGKLGYCPHKGPESGVVEVKRRLILPDPNIANQPCRNCGDLTNGYSACERCRAIFADRKRREHEKNRLSCFEHYGLVCAKCSEPNTHFLTFDHINNNGAEHRRADKSAIAHLGTWLHRHGYPSGFQVLCYNCNSSKGRLNSLKAS